MHKYFDLLVRAQVHNDFVYTEFVKVLHVMAPASMCTGIFNIIWRDIRVQVICSNQRWCGRYLRNGGIQGKTKNKWSCL